MSFFAPAVPEKNPVFRVTEVQRHSVSLVWAPPLEPNGILTGYLLEYQLSMYILILNQFRHTNDATKRSFFPLFFFSACSSNDISEFFVVFNTQRLYVQRFESILG